MAKKESVAEKFVTPVGDLMWVFITDEGKEDLNGNPRFVASLYLHKDSKEFKAAEKRINDFWEANKPKGAKMKSNGIKVVQEKDDDGELHDTDMMSLNFWTGITYPNGKPKVIEIFNSKNPPSKVSLGDKKIGNGSRGCISGAMDIYNRPEGKGVTLYLNAIQLTKFVEFTGSDPGFGAVDDGEESWDGTVDEETGFEGQSDEAKPRL